MFIFTATAHFNKMKHDLAQMIPAYFPRPLLIVYITAVLELLGAAGLVFPQVRRLAGICLIALLIGMFVANVNAAQKGVTLRGKPPTPVIRTNGLFSRIMVIELISALVVVFLSCNYSGLAFFVLGLRNRLQNGTSGADG